MTADITDTMELSALMHAAEAQLASTPTPRLDALVLLEYASGKPHAWLHAHAKEPVAACLGADGLQTYQELISKRRQSIPVAYITGAKEFYGLDLEVTPDVMIPRPESEALVEYAIDTAPGGSALLDVGTGSGALAITTKYHRPDLTVHASDLSTAALTVARSNAHQHKTDITFITSDLCQNVPGCYSTVIANLPYLPNDYPVSPETAHEPASALYAAQEGLALYQALFTQLPAHTDTESTVLLEGLPEHMPRLKNLGTAAGFEYTHQLNRNVIAFTR